MRDDSVTAKYSDTSFSNGLCQPILNDFIVYVKKVCFNNMHSFTEKRLLIDDCVWNHKCIIAQWKLGIIIIRPKSREI